MDRGRGWSQENCCEGREMVETAGADDDELGG